MTSRIKDDEYDENCVFNRVLAKNPKPVNSNAPTLHSADRLERIFGPAKSHFEQSPVEPIHVADFLPTY